jgi:hypothetical protein
MDRKAARRRQPEPETAASEGWELEPDTEKCWLDGARPAFGKTISPGWRIVLCPSHVTELDSVSGTGYEHAQPPRGFHGRDWPWKPDDR